MAEFAIFGAGCFRGVEKPCGNGDSARAGIFFEKTGKSSCVAARACAVQ